ncbi:MAG: NADH pyrophosphatase, partial [Paracoccaceae bacterium]
MKIAETVTFGGSGLDRAAELRGDAAALTSALAAADSRTVLFWRGKPLLADGPEGRTLARLPLSHPVLA